MNRRMPSASSITVSTLGLVIFVINLVNLQHASAYWYLLTVPIAITWVLLSRRVASRVTADLASRRARAPSLRRMILGVTVLILLAAIVLTALNLLLPSSASAATAILVLATVLIVGKWQIVTVHTRSRD